MKNRLLLRARLVVPVARPPIENGVVGVAGDRITVVDRGAIALARAEGEVIDLGEVVLLPGLINAHCHLDYTHMAGQIPPLKRFTDWIKAIVALKSGWSYSEFAESWLEGAQMLARTGTTTVADIETVPELVPEVWEATPLRVVSFRELIHLRERPTAEALVRAVVEEWSKHGLGKGGLGLSPHAPYSTSEPLLRQAAHAARARGWLLSTHLAESEEEFEMFRHRRGPLYEWLKTQRPMQDCGGMSPVRYLASCGFLGPDLLAVHVNYLDHGDAALLAEHQVHVVHCPRSHAYFGHAPFPGQELLRAGANVCLGTDSLASMTQRRGKKLELNMFEEMRCFARTAPDWDPSAILGLATLRGARALGRPGELGELTRHARADLISVPYAGPAEEALEWVVAYGGSVRHSMVRGRWVVPPGEVS